MHALVYNKVYGLPIRHLNYPDSCALHLPVRVAFYLRSEALMLEAYHGLDVRQVGQNC